MKVFHPHGLSGQFQKPHGVCFPLNKVIKKIQTPTTSGNWKTYVITEEEKNKIQNYFERKSV